MTTMTLMTAYDAFKEDVQCVAPPHYTITNQKLWQGGDGGDDDSNNASSPLAGKRGDNNNNDNNNSHPLLHNNK